MFSSSMFEMDSTPMFIAISSGRSEKKKKKVGLREKKVILAKGKNKTLFAKSVRYLMVLIFAVKGNNFRDKWGWTMVSF